ncbi:hypothetical protein PSEUBRA_002793 [Kalmanozyma brasiliensis GHG001]|uniref:uncharacterized protein n=1 Tax=Kalmanozyma brasiliensis (strain GHG001) TaxID=1365824 RepID=UPI002867BA38|nr:uncharacterized protein PSEUBRA_002793 [Kalmanozyma brasiliensis GHG001]KAF6767131.1 hypothetical protein PSEUBRA_002793 [Kalmanozyma brasiliensis GHG001]
MAHALTNPFSEPASTSSGLWTRLSTRRSSPLRFVLRLSRRPNAALCPCLETTLTSPSGTFTITRILDPEHRTPYITLSPIFLSSGLTPIQGLLRFALPPTSFDLSLAGLEPFDDFWVTLPVARRIASDLTLLPSLAAILDPKTSLAWSLDEFSEGLSHNWTIPPECVAPERYSTDAITQREVRFGGLEMLPRGQVVRTLVSGELRGRVEKEERERRGRREERMREALIRWCALLWGVWWDVRETLDGEGEGRDGRVRALLDDLRDLVVPPTPTDTLEWMQLISPLNAEAQSSTSPSSTQPLQDEGVLSPLRQEELADQRSKEITLGEMLVPYTADDPDKMVARLESILRAKMASLHHMTLLSLPHLSSSDAQGTDPQHAGALDEETDEASKAVGFRHARPTEGRSDEVQQLHTKVDDLTSKLDYLVASQSSPHRPRQLPVSTSAASRGPSLTATESILAAPSAVISNLIDSISTLRLPHIIIIAIAIASCIIIKSPS